MTRVGRRRCAEADCVADLREPIKPWPIPEAVLHLAGGFADCAEHELADTDLTIARNLLASISSDPLCQAPFAHTT